MSSFARFGANRPRSHSRPHSGGYAHPPRFSSTPVPPPCEDPDCSRPRKVGKNRDGEWNQFCNDPYCFTTGRVGRVNGSRSSSIPSRGSTFSFRSSSVPSTSRGSTFSSHSSSVCFVQPVRLEMVAVQMQHGPLKCKNGCGRDRMPGRGADGTWNQYCGGLVYCYKNGIQHRTTRPSSASSITRNGNDLSCRHTGCPFRRSRDPLTGTYHDFCAGNFNCASRGGPGIRGPGIPFAIR